MRVECMFDRACMHCLIVNLKAGSKLTDLILPEMIFHILGAKNYNDSVTIYSDFAAFAYS